MFNVSRLKYYLFYYRYNILVPSVIGGIIINDYLNLKEKRRRAVLKAEREAARQRS